MSMDRELVTIWKAIPWLKPKPYVTCSFMAAKFIASVNFGNFKCPPSVNFYKEKKTSLNKIFMTIIRKSSRGYVCGATNGRNIFTDNKAAGAQITGFCSRHKVCTLAKLIFNLFYFYAASAGSFWWLSPTVWHLQRFLIKWHFYMVTETKNPSCQRLQKLLVSRLQLFFFFTFFSKWRRPQMSFVWWTLQLTFYQVIRIDGREISCWRVQESFGTTFEGTFGSIFSALYQIWSCGCG